jgi:hypothetical protein
MQSWVSCKYVHLYDVKFDLWNVESIGLPSVMMWGDRGEARCCGLSKVWNGGEGCDLHSLWLVMLESIKDWVLGVDTPRQKVPPHVWCGTTCLQKDAVGSVPDEWEIDVVTHLGSHGARGAVVSRTTPGNLSIAMVSCTTLAKPNIQLIVNLCNNM